MQLPVQILWSTAHLPHSPASGTVRRLRRAAGALLKLLLLVALLLAGRLTHAQTSADVLAPKPGTVANKVLAASVAYARTPQIL